MRRVRRVVAFGEYRGREGRAELFGETLVKEAI